MQTECGHLFCKGCLEPVLEGPNPVCPIDKTSISRNEVRFIVCGVCVCVCVRGVCVCVCVCINYKLY